MQTQNKYKLTRRCQPQGLHNKVSTPDIWARGTALHTGCKSCPVGKWICRNL